MSLKTLFVAAGTCVLAACATAEDADLDLQVRTKAWSQIERETDATFVGSNMLRISASTPFAGDIDVLEGNLLARAAGEAVRRNAKRFAIVFLDYDDPGLGDRFFGGSLGTATTDWIGSYDALLAARADNDPDESLERRFGYRRVTAVVRLLAPGEEMGADSFDAQETYTAFLNERIERRNIRVRGAPAAE